MKSPDPLYRQIKEYLDSIPAFETHDHLRPFDRLQGYVQTERGRGMNLFGLINTSYYPRIKPVVRENLIRDETWRDSASPQLEKRT
ncbi:MAG: hypothetical protein LAO04_19770 [Acidobacteriia bacterium]|nr:hypothetical protein [Terriglobia bacterium]